MTQWREGIMAGGILAWQRRLGLVFGTLALLLAASAALADIGSLAFVGRDATLRVGHKTVHLFGIYIPDTGRTCDTFLQPTRCGSHAALALDRKIQGFVYCEYLSRNPDRSYNAVCRIDADGARFGEREDLAAFLLREGWAVALPGAPFEYVTLERIARSQGRGIWGFRADSIEFR